MAKRKLTPKQAAFVREYLIDLNATAAAKRAGYKDPNIGRQLITKDNVSDEIARAMKKREHRTEITQDKVLEEIAAIAFADSTDYAQVDSEGEVSLTPTSELTPKQRKAVAGIKAGQWGTEVKLNDKLRALELLGKHLGMFEKPEQKEEAPPDDGFLDALKGEAGEVWEKD